MNNYYNNYSNIPHDDFNFGNINKKKKKRNKKLEMQKHFFNKEFQKLKKKFNTKLIFILKVYLII